MSKASEGREVWVAVGTNPDIMVPTWFFALTTSKNANAFVEKAKTSDPRITWDVYPCALELPEDAFKVFLECSSEENDDDPQ